MLSMLVILLISPKIVASVAREFRDVAFEDVVLDNNSSVTPY